MWLEVEIEAVGEAVRISGRGSEGERPAPHTMSLGMAALTDLAGKVGRAARGGKALDAAVVQQAQALHEEVFQGDLRDVLARLSGAAGERLLVRLFVGDRALHGVPWEALCKPGTSEGFLGTDPRVLLARGVASKEPWEPREVQGAVRVLAIAPGSGKGALSVLREALGPSIDAREVAWLEPIVGDGISAEALYARIRGEKEAPHVVHWLGHGYVDEHGVPKLRLADDDGEEVWVAAGAVAQELSASFREDLRLVVLEACEGAKSGAFGSAGEVLAKAGADAVVAHLWPVRADAARMCSKALYQSLTSPGRLAGDIGAGVAAARRTLLAKSAEAFSPVLFLRGSAAVIFDFKGRGAGAEKAEKKAPEVSIARLPATSRELFGREKELAWLDACWEEGVRVASIVAFGGVGKSALVNAWLARMDKAEWRGAERVYGWSFYSQGTDRLTSSDEFVASTLRELGDPEPEKGSPWDKGERLAKLVRRERMILVLDGLEPLQWGPGVEAGKLKDPALQALIKELGAQNNGLCIIASRIAVADLDAVGGNMVRAHDLDHLSAEAGAELLKARGAKGVENELEEVAREYDGHSLALMLLGTYLRKAHKGDIRKRDLIPPLEGKPAHRMMATYERWFADMPELAILRMLGLFDRPAPQDEIAALRAKPPVAGLTDKLEGMTDGAWNTAVTTLRDVGLLAVGAEGDDRLDAHPLVREHFGEQLRREQPDAWREGHRRLYEHLRATAKELPETVEEMAPLYAAVVHGCLAGKHQDAVREVYRDRIERQNQYFNMKRLGAFGSTVAALSAFFDPPWERLAPGLTEVWQAWVLNQAGSALQALGRMPEAVGPLRLSMKMSIAQQDWKNAAQAASNLGDLLQSRGELSDALAQVRKSVDLADKSGDAFQSMSRRATLAAALHVMGLHEEAAVQFEEAERLQEEGQPAYPRLYSLRGFRYCELLVEQGRDAEVRERAEELLARRTPDDPLLDIALDHLSLGRAHLLAAQRGAAGDLSEAASQLQQAVDGIRHAGRQEYLPLGLLARAALRTRTRAFLDARHDLDEALTLATRCGFRLHEADAHLGHARLALAKADPPAARAHLAAARRIIDDTGYHRRDGELAELEAACR